MLKIRNSQKFTIVLLSITLLLSLLIGMSYGSVSISLKTIFTTFTYLFLFSGDAAENRGTIESVILKTIFVPIKYLVKELLFTIFAFTKQLQRSIQCIYKQQWR